MGGEGLPRRRLGGGGLPHGRSASAEPLSNRKYIVRHAPAAAQPLGPAVTNNDGCQGVPSTILDDRPPWVDGSACAEALRTAGLKNIFRLGLGFG